MEAMFDFAQSFLQLHLNDTEIGLFTGVVLATAGEGHYHYNLGGIWCYRQVSNIERTLVGN